MLESSSKNAAAATDQGKRPSQKDYSFIQDEKDLPSGVNAICVVADGHGESGERASREATQTFVSALKQQIAQEGLQNIEQLLRRCVDIAHDELVNKFINGGTTLVGVVYVKDKVYFVNIGDSRGYLLPKGRDEHIKRITVDHNVPQRSNIVTRALGDYDRLPHDPDVVSCSVYLSDYIIICSDGIAKVLSDSQIEELVRGKSPLEAVKAIMQKAESGEDNKTVLILQIF